MHPTNAASRILRLACIGIVTSLCAAAVRASESVAPWIVAMDVPAGAAFAPAVARALHAPIRTVVDKPSPSPTGDPHDYVSYARYFWPNPVRPGSLPFVRRDGHVNREQVDKGDRGRLGRFVETVSVLSMAWHRDHRADCARRAGEWIRAWFLAPATRMNPNMDYAQVRIGHNHNQGNHTGVLDSRGFADVVDALRLLDGSPALAAGERVAVRSWFEHYDDWLMRAEPARLEREARNNHGSWYLVQAIAIARYLGRDNEARALCREDEARIAWQIRPDGSQPLELVRQDALGYSVFNLEAQLRVASLAEGLGIDLWRYKSPSGASLRGALDALRPYNERPSRWPGRELAALHPGFLDPLLAQAKALDATGT